ncbi:MULTISPECIES: type III secretion protein HrpV [Pseudomonas]|uniref:Type III secretion protein HrpV n=1 Tax=Pseudomonas quercus TaxID=2722792 RepID=A0ABX0YIZ8_9PSED|nr:MULTISPECIES: type III secretion protein HrpV [Pseudomonas]MBF7143257.1 type III secretion protein HrpV [Pseudomonas sp. LY10J]NJP03434.1 type III secretion protein HrpV [Pseudomonas quercus]
MIQVAEKGAFYEHLLAEQAATWPIAKGVCFVSCREHRRWGLALQVTGQVLSPQQLRTALARRFREAERFNDYFLFFDARQAFVIWRGLPQGVSPAVPLDDIRSTQLALAGLEHLFN